MRKLIYGCILIVVLAVVLYGWFPEMLPADIVRDHYCVRVTNFGMTESYSVEYTLNGGVWWERVTKAFYCSWSPHRSERDFPVISRDINQMVGYANTIQTYDQYIVQQQKEDASWANIEAILDTLPEEPSHLWNNLKKTFTREVPDTTIVLCP